MRMGFFELKYLITECFYEQVTLYGRSFAQAVGISYESYTEYTTFGGIEEIVSVSTLISLQIRHKEPLQDCDIADINRVFELMKVIPVNTLLDQNEYRYFEEDIKIIKQEYLKENVPTVKKECNTCIDKKENVNFYELRFLIVNSFYTNVIFNEYSLEQASNMCYEMFVGEINFDSIDNIMAITTIIRLQIRNGLQLTEVDIENMRRLLESVKIVPINTILDENEYEYFEGYIIGIERIYNKLIKEQKGNK